MTTIIQNPDNGITIKEANDLLESNPMLFIKKNTDIVYNPSEKSLANVPINNLEHVANTLKNKVREYIHGQILVSKFEQSESNQNISLGITNYLETIKAEINNILEIYGNEINLRYKEIVDFYEKIDYDINKSYNIQSIGNFIHIIEEIKLLKKEINRFKNFIKELSNTSEFGKGFPGMIDFGRNFIDNGEAFINKLKKLEYDLKYIWTSKEVRLGYKKYSHEKNINDLSKNRPIFETDTTVERLNNIHSKIYGMEKLKVAGPALVGPPGWGKTQLFVDYFRNNGIEPIQIDIDPGQSAFILMARPIVGNTEKYEYGPILQAMESNTPIIINEFIELQEWTFINGLLTCTPANDKEAGEKPINKPKEGEEIKNPKGWFFNTITSEWLRVRENFRVVFSANLGEEYGYSDIPPSLESRIGSGLFEINGLPANEIVEGIIWTHLSSKENKQFLLDDKTAYKLHFFITKIYEKLIKQIRENHPGEHYSLAVRELIDLCSNMNPDITDNPCSLDEAIMRSIVRPLIAKRKGEILDTVVAILLGSGFIRGYSDEIDKNNSSIGSGKLEIMISEIKDPFSITEYTEEEDIYKEKCFICGVTKCPVHGRESKESIDYNESLDTLMKLGLNRESLDKIENFQKDLVKKKTWELLVESFDLGNDISIIGNLDKESKKSIGEFLESQLKNLEKYPLRAKKILKIINVGEKKGLITISKETKLKISKIVFDEWFENINNELKRNSKQIININNDFLDLIILLIDFNNNFFDKKNKSDDNQNLKLLKEILGNIYSEYLDIEIYGKLKNIDRRIKGKLGFKAPVDIENEKSVFLSEIIKKASRHDNVSDLNLESIITYDKILDRIIPLIESKLIDIDLLNITINYISDKITTYKGDNYIPIIRLVSKISIARKIRIDRVISNIVDDKPKKLPNILNY